MVLGVDFLPVDMTQLVAVVLGCMIPLVFVVGLTMRFAAKPLVEALGKLRENGAPARELEVLTRRVLELEQTFLFLCLHDGGPALAGDEDRAAAPRRPGVQRARARPGEHAAAAAVSVAPWTRCRSI